VLDFAGFDVTREYYINDAGRQMDILALSTWLRYLDLFGIAVAFPPNAYQGDYVKDMAAQIKEAHGDRFAKVSAADVLPDAPSVEADKKATWTR
jgi:arginyl-tRNA synthetase